VVAHGRRRGSTAVGRWGNGVRRGTGRRGGQLSGGPRGVSWLIGGRSEVADSGGSVMASTVV
jgi:hypothetical protein